MSMDLHQTKFKISNVGPKLKDIVSEGIRYSAYSDRGRQVKRMMAQDRVERARMPISLLLMTSVALCSTIITT